MRARLVLVAGLAALVTAAPAGAADRVVERGIIQSIDSATLVLRALDGTDVTVPLGPATRYRLNGRDASLVDIQPGFVAEAVVSGSTTAVLVRAFGRPERPVERGVVVRLAARAIVLRRGPGDTVRLRVNERTVVWRGAARVRLRALRPGMRVEVTLSATGAARVILIRRTLR
jgi:hypothetical protein